MEFKHPPESLQRLYHAAHGGTYTEFMATYRSSDAMGPEGSRLLEIALGREPEVRVAMASRLLDDGANPATKDEDGLTMLHILVDGHYHDFGAEAPLLQRLLNGGADVNAVHKKRGTPLETVASLFKYDETQLTPLYDVFVARPDLDPLKISAYGHTVLSNIRRWDRPLLAGRLEEYLRERGIDVPAP